MASFIPGYEYDIFISYRQKDNKYDGWVTEFVNNLKKELEATFKEEISVYFDINPHDGLLETHDVDASLKEKLKCLVFIPIISRTYCDQKSFAWEHEFKAFIEQASTDQFGLKVKMPNGNVASRVLPIRIYDLDTSDIKLCESVLGGVLRSVDFIYKSAGVNRPLLSKEENPQNNLNHTNYRDQINKVANSIKEIINAIGHHEQKPDEVKKEISKPLSIPRKSNKTTIISGSIIVLTFIVLGFLFIPKLFKSEEQIEKSIAVLPFENWNSDEEYMHLGDAIANEINTQLSKIKEFHVFSYTSTKQFKGSDKPPVPVIGKELGANFIIEGTVERQKEDVSIHVQVIKADSDDHLWAEEFKGKWEDIFTIRAEIAVRIAEELKTVLSPEEIRKIKKNPTENAEAYNLYLKGRYFWNKRTAEGFQTGIEYFYQAIEKDPTYSLAYAGIADCYNLLGWHDLLSPEEVHQKAKAAAEKALMMDETLSEAHASLAYVKMLYDWDWQAAGKEFKRALELNPNYAEAHQWYSEYLAYMGRHDESISEAERAQELDPLSLSINHNLGLILYEAHQFDLAIEKYQKTLEMDPGFIVTYNYLGLAYAGKKMYNEAITNVQKAIDLTEEQSPLYIGTLGFIYASMGNRDEAEKILEHLVELSQQRYIAPVSLAIICGTLGQKDQAFEWMEKGYEVRDDFMMGLKVEPRLDSLRSDPRYQDLLERMKLSD